MFKTRPARYGQNTRLFPPTGGDIKVEGLQDFLELKSAVRINHFNPWLITFVLNDSVSYLLSKL